MIWPFILSLAAVIDHSWAMAVTLLAIGAFTMVMK